MPEKKKELLTYKGLPLVRANNTICYGDAASGYVVVLDIFESKTERGMSMPTKVLVQLIRTDEGLSAVDRMVKSAAKESLYDAFEIGEIWLERFLGERTQQ